MSWQISFQQDTDTKGVGTATATYSDGVGPVVVHQRRLDTNDGHNIDLFITEALASLQKHEEQTSELDAVISKIQAKLNG